MLVPALVYKEELLKQFAKEMYTDRYFYYMGYTLGHELPTIDDSDNVFRWAIVDPKFNVVLGYFAYAISSVCSSVSNFGWYSFSETGTSLRLGAISKLVISDIKDKMNELFSQWHKVTWEMVSGNRVEPLYDKLLEEAASKGYQTYKNISHDCTKDQYGNFHDSIEYEVINPNK